MGRLVISRSACPYENAESKFVADQIAARNTPYMVINKC